MINLRLSQNLDYNFFTQKMEGISLRNLKKIFFFCTGCRKLPASSFPISALIQHMPCPHWPATLSPHAHSSPLLVTAAVCSSPHPTSTTAASARSCVAVSSAHIICALVALLFSFRFRSYTSVYKRERWQQQATPKNK